MTFPTLVVEAAFSASAQDSGANYLYLDDTDRGKLDTGTLAGEIWADITGWVRSCSIKRGSERFDGPNVRYEAGRASIVLDNRDRRFDPTDTAGPYAVAGVTQVVPMRAVRIRATHGSNLLSADNASFETSLGTWTGSTSNPTTVARVTTYALDGAYSMSMTRNTSVGAAVAQTVGGVFGFPVEPGTAYTLIAHLRPDPAATARSVRIDRTWYDAAGAQISYVNGVAVTETAGQFTKVVEHTSAAPAGAAYLRILIVVLNCAVGETHHADRVGMLAGTVSAWSPPATTYDLFRGFADSYNIEYPTRTVDRGDSICTLQCTDATKVLSNYDGPEQVSQGAGETTGARVTRILNNAGWSATDRVIATGDTTLQATTLAQSAWTELLLVADTELGEIYVDGAGRVVFRNRQASLEDARSITAQAVFGDGTDELRYQDVELNYDDTQIRNLIQVARTGGVQQTKQDTPSQLSYLTHTWERTDLLMQNDTVAADYAGWVLYQSKDPELRFSQLKLNPRHDEDLLFPQVLGRRFGDRITVKRRPPGGGTISRDVFIRGISHDISPQRWETTWGLQSATKYAFLVLDHASLGVLDSNALAF